jgi:SpoVK/Ycf46/Vps4 family AAA+-type ATPase
VCHAGGGGAVRLAATLSQCIAEGCSQAPQDRNRLQDKPSHLEAGEHSQRHKVAVVASTEAVEEVAAPLRRCFTHELPLEAPDKEARLAILQVHFFAREKPSASNVLVFRQD